MIEFIKPFLNSTVGTDGVKPLDRIVSRTVEEQIYNLRKSNLEFDGWEIDKLIISPFNKGGITEDIEISVDGDVAKHFHGSNLIFNGTFRQFDIYIVDNPIINQPTSIISDVTLGYKIDYSLRDDRIIFRTKSVYDSISATGLHSSMLNTLGDAIRNIGFPTNVRLHENYSFACTLIKGRLIELNKRP